MKLRYPVYCCLVLLAFGCNKDKYTVNPHLSLKSYSKEVAVDGSFNAVLIYDQKKGNLNGDSLLVIRHRYNQTVPVNEPSDTFFTQLIVGIDPTMPDAEIPASDHAEFHFSLAYALLHVADNENDTIDFKFALTDLAGRSSDTVQTGKIVILTQ